MENDTIVPTATVNNPTKNYADRVFRKARVPRDSTNYKLELGYLVTAEGFEGKGFCRKLLSDFMPRISHDNMFATTANTHLEKMLTSLGFLPVGNQYDHDIQLLVYNRRL